MYMFILCYFPTHCYSITALDYTVYILYTTMQSATIIIYMHMYTTCILMLVICIRTCTCVYMRATKHEGLTRKNIHKGLRHCGNM